MALTLSGFQVNEQIFKSERTLIHRGTRIADNAPIVVKQSSSPYPGHSTRRG
jgi:hypothetical protein